MTELTSYFSNLWNPRLHSYHYSGWKLLEKISPIEHVLDVGCGHNLFKPYLPHLVGVDPSFEQADHQCTIQEFKTDQKFDVAVCLGSVNFGSEHDIIEQLEKINSLMKPKSRIYWRSNPGHNDHKNKKFEKFVIYPWSFNKHAEFAKQFEYKLSFIKWDIIQDHPAGPDRQRIYAEWIR